MADKTGSRLAVPYRLKRGIFQYIKFKMISLSNAAIDIGCLNLFLLAWPTKDSQLLLLYNTIAYILAVTNSYIWNSRFTFNKHFQNGHKQKILFACQAGVSLIINNLAFLGGIKLLSLVFSSIWIVDNGAKEISMFCSSTASFFFLKFIVFREDK